MWRAGPITMIDRNQVSSGRVAVVSSYSRPISWPFPCMDHVVAVGIAGEAGGAEGEGHCGHLPNAR
jgi:hypothetical protein